MGKRVRGNNLFNLRADGSWQGPTIAGDGGKTYRAYPSRDESMKDYLAYLQDNPRFGRMFEPVTRGSVERLAGALQRAGFADDPAYANKIMATASAPTLRHALYRYGTWPPGGGQTGDEVKRTENIAEAAAT
jgi:flagellar protein FlgJ